MSRDAFASRLPRSPPTSRTPLLYHFSTPWPDSIRSLRALASSSRVAPRPRVLELSRLPTLRRSSARSPSSAPRSSRPRPSPYLLSNRLEAVRGTFFVCAARVFVSPLFLRAGPWRRDFHYLSWCRTAARPILLRHLVPSGCPFVFVCGPYCGSGLASSGLFWSGL